MSGSRAGSELIHKVMDPNKCQSVDEFVGQLSKKEAKELLQRWREENARNAELVRHIWLSVDGLGSYLGDEKWVVLEQVCLAGLDLHDKLLVDECVAQLAAKFPGSTRVRRLRLMAKLELTERYQEAQSKYDELLQSDEANCLLHKRKIAVLMAARRHPEAIRALCDYLKRFLNDHEAWAQLCELYVREQEYGRAAFCAEELILSNPHNHLYHERYAEIQYTMGTPESVELARAYYAQSVRLQPTSLRALYGLLLSCNLLAGMPRTAAPKRKECLRLAQWAAGQVTQLYHHHHHHQSGDQPGPLLQSLDSALEGLSLAAN